MKFGSDSINETKVITMTKTANQIVNVINKISLDTYVINLLL